MQHHRSLQEYEQRVLEAASLVVFGWLHGAAIEVVSLGNILDMAALSGCTSRSLVAVNRIAHVATDSSNTAALVTWRHILRP